ncbi:hypothetical protein GKODMF_01125 [Candidatus Electrothrix gigas]
MQEHNENVIEQAASQPVEEKGNSEVSSDSASDGGATLSPSAGKQSCSLQRHVLRLAWARWKDIKLSVEKDLLRSCPHQ